MRKRNVRIFGLVFVVLGLILSVNSLRMTGFAVFESVEGTASSIIGILLVVGGILLIVLARDRNYTHFRSRAALRQHNEEAHWAARRAYAKERGHKPTHAELRKYERALHDSGDYESIVEEEKREH